MGNIAGEINDSSRKNDKREKRLIKEESHWCKASKKPKSPALRRSNNHTRDKELINRFMSGDDYDDLDFDD